MAASISLTGCLVFMLAVGDCAKILIIIGMASPSHYNVFAPIIQELAARKHEITVQSFYTLKEPLPNVKEIKLTQNPFADDKGVMRDAFLNLLKQTPVGLVSSLYPFIKPICKAYLTDETTKELIAEGKQYDVVVIDALFAECQRAVASLLGPFIIDVYTSGVFPWVETSTPTPPSYVPVYTDLMPSRMNFWQRFANAYNQFWMRYSHRYELQPQSQEVLSELLPQAASIEDSEKKVVFSIDYGDPVVLSPRPSTPDSVHCGGGHCRKGKPLPKDLQEFVDSSGDDGFIVFGLGSNMKSEYLLPEDLQAILSAFSRLKQNVIWKFEGKLDNIPKNVKTLTWMPQQDLLAHPKARLFITHSGMLSLQEAIYHGVPVIGIPFFADQRGNIARMKELGIGEHFDFLNLTEDGFYDVITRVLNDKSYYENMKKYSRIFKDQPDRPVDRAVFWIEYVIRHNGARHFRSAGKDLNFFQYFLLDVAAFVLVISLTVVGVVVFLCKLTLKKLCGAKNVRKANDKKNK